MAALRLLVSLRLPHAAGFDVLLEEERRARRLSPADAALARELAYGVCRHRRWLEHILARYLQKPLAKKAFHVHESLLIGLYQALFLDRIPKHSIVDETVRLVGAFRTEATYRGLANAIMRRVVGEERESLLPKESDHWPLRLGVPDWLATEAGQVLPKGEQVAFFEACNKPAPLCFRRCAIPGTPEGLELEERLRAEIIDQTHALPLIDAAPHAPECLLVEARGLMPDLLPLFRWGMLTIEDEAAQIVCHLAGAAPGERLLDLCASPGGKTAHLADLAERRAKIVACDISDEKLIRLRETLQRLGLLDSIRTAIAEELLEESQPGSFERVLVDAPCSSLGTMRRHPEVRWRRDPKTLKDYAERQRRILASAAPLVAPGGRLIYSVCTFTAQETDGVVDAFLINHSEFRPAEAPQNLPFDDAPFRVGQGRWRTFPHRHGCDGFFVAAFQRT